MNEKINHLRRQIDVFNTIEFTAIGHTYTINGNAARSVTELLNAYVKPFESEYWAKRKAAELNLEVEEILKRWEFNAKLSKTKGSLVHSFIESIFCAYDFDYPEHVILNEFGYDPIQDAFNQITLQVHKFMADIQDKMFPVATEFVIGDPEYLVCGTIDQLFYNQKSDKLEIWDWKTNKEIKTTSRYYHLAPLNHIPDTELDHYSLQLSLYKLILEKNTGLELGNSYLTWFNENTAQYQIFRTKDYSVEAQLILRTCSTQ